jgi:hypothetical protein
MFHVLHDPVALPRKPSLCRALLFTVKVGDATYDDTRNLKLMPAIHVSLLSVRVPLQGYDKPSTWYVVQALIDESCVKETHSQRHDGTPGT